MKFEENKTKMKFEVEEKNAKHQAKKLTHFEFVYTIVRQW